MFCVSVVSEKNGTVSRVVLEGQIDGPASSELDGKLAEMIQGDPGPVIFDLSQVTFVTSAGLRVFLSFAKKMKKAERKMVLCGAQAGVLSSFEMAGFTRIMTFCDSMENSFAALETNG